MWCYSVVSCWIYVKLSCLTFMYTVLFHASLVTSSGSLWVDEDPSKMCCLCFLSLNAPSTVYVHLLCVNESSIILIVLHMKYRYMYWYILQYIVFSVKSRCSSRCWHRNRPNGRNTKQKELRGWKSYLKCFLGPNHSHEFKRMVLYGHMYFICNWLQTVAHTNLIVLWTNECSDWIWRSHIHLVLISPRKPPGLVQGDVQSDFFVKLWGFYLSWTENGAAYSSSRRG